MMMTLNELLESKTIGKRLEQMKVSLEDVINKLLECDTDDYRVIVYFDTKLFEIVLRDEIRAIDDDELIKCMLNDEPKMKMFVNWLTSYCDSIFKINSYFYNVKDWTVEINKDVVFFI